MADPTIHDYFLEIERIWTEFFETSMTEGERDRLLAPYRKIIRQLKPSKRWE